MKLMNSQGKKNITGLIFIFLIFAITLVSAGWFDIFGDGKSCENSLTYRECDDNGKSSLEIFGDRYYDGSEWIMLDMKIKSSNKVGIDYEIENSFYKVKIKDKDTISLERGGSTFIIDIKKWDILSVTDNSIEFDISDNDLQGTLTYTFEKDKVTKLIRIDNIDKTKDYEFVEDFDFIGNFDGTKIGDFKISDEVYGYDSGIKEYKDKSEIDSQNKKTKIKLDKEFLGTATFPIYIDPPLEIDGTDTVLCGSYTYDYVSLVNGASITICAENGTAGSGILNITATDNITIDSTSKIVGDFKGDEGGAGRTVSSSNSGLNGNDGTGSGGGNNGNYNPTAVGGTYCASSGGGGGGHQDTGGNGGHANTLSYGNTIAGNGGSSYGDDFGYSCFRGSGGASGGASTGATGTSAISGAGGEGGACILLNSSVINIQGNVTATGEDASGGSTAGGRSCSGGSAGGSGGTIVLIAGTLNITNSTLKVDAGDGSAGLRGEVNTNVISGGGGGGTAGRIKIFFNSISNLSSITTFASGSGGGTAGGGAGSTGVVGFINYTDTEELEVFLISPSNNTEGNSTVNFTCNATLTTLLNTELDNVTLNIWNTDSTLNATVTQDVSGIFNVTNLTHKFQTNDTYLWNCKYFDNESGFDWGNTNFTINVNLSAPIVKLNSPADGNQSGSQNITFNCSAQSPFGVRNISLLLNDGLNHTYFADNSTQDELIKELDVPESLVDYNWSCLSYNNFSEFNYAPANFTLTVDTPPEITIVEPTATASSLTIDYNVTFTDTDMQNCSFNVTRGASVEVSTIFNNCSEFNGTFVVSSDATYVFHVAGNDTLGHYNFTNITVVVSTAGTPPSGGGGGITIIGEAGEPLWNMATETNSEKYQFEMIAGSSRTKPVVFENLGDSSRTIKLSCVDIQGDLCQYVEFEEETFVLPLIKEFRTGKDFSVDLPDNIEDGEQIFNVKATDDLGKTGEISVQVNVGNFGVITEIFVKFASSFKLGNFRFNYFIFAFLPMSLILGFGTFFIGVRKLPAGALWSLLIAFIIPSIIILTF